MGKFFRPFKNKENKIFKFFITESILLLIAYCCAIFFVVLNQEMIYSHWIKYFLLSFFHISLVQSLMLGFGLYNHITLYRRHERIPRLLLAHMAAFFVTVQLVYVIPALDLGHVIWLAIYLFSILLLMLGRYTRINIGDDKRFKRQVLVLGAGKKAHQLHKQFGDSSPGTIIHGYIHVPGERELIDKEKIIYAIKNLKQVVGKKKIDAIIVAVDDRRHQFPLTQLLEMKFIGIEIIDLLKFYERECGYIKLDIMDPSFLIFSKGFHFIKVTHFFKRTMDVCCALCVLIITMPIILFCMCSMFISFRYKKEMFKKEIFVGMNGQFFNKYLFNFNCSDNRSLYLLKKKIVNLPQWFNVLSGDLSIIGPAPKSPREHANGLKNIPYYQVRAIVKPGIVGWLHIKLEEPFANNCIESSEIEFQYDIYYIKNQTFFLDFIILISCYSLKSKIKAEQLVYGSP